MKSKGSLLALILAAGTLAAITAFPELWKGPIRGLFPDLSSHLYDRSSFSVLLYEHLILSGISGGLSAVIGIGLGIFVTRQAGRDFLPAVNGLVSIGQTFPPVAVLALAVPAVGFGALPTIIALFVYGLLPIVRNTIAGLESISPVVKEAARGMGMSPLQSLFKVELPLALSVIMAGVRISLIINIGTATLGATVGAGGLGAPIISGLVNDNPAFILEGAVTAGLFAVLIDLVLDRVEKGMQRADA